MEAFAQPIRKSARLRDFNYALSGTYFVTICLQDMSRMRFGSVENGELMLSDAGLLIVEAWETTFERFSGAAFDSMVVMPNHLHAIVQIGINPNVQTPNLTSVIGAFKSISTVEYARNVRQDRFPPFDGSLWQRSFYDRILSGERAIESARRYIEGNPARWIARYMENTPK